MKIDIFYVSKYGATKQISQIIKTKLKSLHADKLSLYNIKEQPYIKNAHLNIVLSPIYGGHALESFHDFLFKNKAQLLRSKIVIYAVALNKPSCFLNGNLKIVEPHVELLPNIIYQDVLLGERIYEKLEQNDKEKLLHFYQHILNLSQHEIEEKQKPAYFINEEQIHKSVDNALMRFYLL